MSSLFNLPWQQAFDSSGNTLAGAKLYFYTAGTSTPQNVYSDINLGVALSNPVIANGAGRFPPIYMDDISYKVALYNDKDELIWTADNVWAQSIDADAAFATAAIKATTVSAGYTEEQAEDASNFPKAVFKYANASTWYTETGNVDNVYILEGFDDYSRPNDYFEGFEAEFYCSRANTSAATVNVEGLGAKNIYHADGTSLNAGDVNGFVHLRFNGTSFSIVPAQVNQYGSQTIYGTKTFDESPIIPTPATTDNSTKAATTAYVQSLFTSRSIPDISSPDETLSSGGSYTFNYTATKNCLVIISGSGAADFKVGDVVVGKTVQNSGSGGYTSLISNLFVPLKVGNTLKSTAAVSCYAYVYYME